MQWVGLQCVTVVFPGHTHLHYIFSSYILTDMRLIASEYDMEMPQSHTTDQPMAREANTNNKYYIQKTLK